MVTTLTMSLSEYSGLDIGALAIVVSLVLCLAIIVSKSKDPSQSKLDQLIKNQGKLDQILLSNTYEIAQTKILSQKLDLIISIINQL